MSHYVKYILIFLLHYNYHNLFPALRLYITYFKEILSEELKVLKKYKSIA